MGDISTSCTIERPIASVGGAFSLQGKVALVTGSSRGLGCAIAERLGQQGAHVVLHGRKQQDLDEVSDRFDARAIDTSTACFDVADREAVQQKVAEIVDENGRIDILINNAGIAGGGTALDLALSDWEAMIDVNLTACLSLARTAGMHMREQRGGRIINISSAAGLFAARDRAAYVTTKHALIGLTRSLALDLAPHGITTNAIAPGFIATDMNAAMRETAQADEWVKARNPQGSWGEPDDVAFAAAYLASDEAKFVNGAILSVDGGMTAVVI